MVSTELIIPPSQPLVVYGGKHPLSNEHHQVEIPAGATIAEALDLVIASTGLAWPADRFVASVNDVRVPREYWRYVRPKPGTTVMFRLVAGDDQNMRSLLFLGIAIAAMFIAPFIAGPAVLGLTGTMLTAGTAIIGGAITIGGALLLNALIPIRPPQQDSAQPKTMPMISGAQNEVRPWGAVPVVLGRHRMSPMFAAMPFSSFKGQDQYIHMLFCCGYGQVEITNLLIGNTPISRFEDIDYEIRTGWVGEPPQTTFTNITDEQPLANVELKSVGGYTTFTTQALSAKALGIDVIAPSGTWIYNKKNGKYENRPVTVNVQYRLVGTSTWINRPNIVFTLNRDTIRRGDHWPVDPAGQYEVRLRKATADYTGNEQVADTVTWSTLRSWTVGAPIVFPKPLALVAMTARATDQFNGIINTFNCVVNSYVQSWNGSAWVYGLSSNPADLFLHVLTGPANARPRQPAQIDYTSIQAWADDCTARNYTYNAIISDQRTVREVLSDIAAAGRATVALRDGKWGVSFPRDDDPVSWHFTPRNSSAFKSSRAYREFPHALRVRFIDSSKGWLQTEGIVYNDTPDGSGDNGMYGPLGSSKPATLFESVEFPGNTHWAQVHKAARYQLAQARLRPETHTLTADVESLRLERGDKVIVSNDVLLIGTGYGRVTAVNAGAQTVTVDSTVTMEAGKSYQIKFTTTVGAILIRTVLNTLNETNVISLSNVDVPATMPAVGNLFSFGETSKVTNDYRVLDVRPGADLSAQFMLVDDAAFHDQYDQEPVPTYDPGISERPDPFELAPVSLTVVEFLAGEGLTAKATVQLTVQMPRIGKILLFEFQARDISTNGVRPINPSTGVQIENDGYWVPFATVAPPLLMATRDNLESGLWEFRVRSVFAADHAGRTTANDSSQWVYSSQTAVVSTLEPPGNVTTLKYTILGELMLMEWDVVASPNVSFYRIKYNPAIDGTASWNSSGELLTSSTNRASVAIRAGTYMIVAVTYSAVESEIPFEKIIVFGPPVQPNILVTLNEGGGFIRSDHLVIDPMSPLFPGTHAATKVSGSLLTLTQPSGTNASVLSLITDLGLASITSSSRSVQQILLDLSLTTNLKLLLEAGNSASWPGGGGQKWLDESGGGYDFFLGADATVSATDPTFVGTVGNSLRSNAYWNFDGGDYFAYDTTSEAWMDAIHKDNAQFSIVVSVYVAALDGITHCLMGNTNSAAQVGFQLFFINNQIKFQTVNGTIVNYAVQSSALTMTAPGWHTIGVSINEVAGTGVFMLDGVTQAFSSVVYPSPSAAAAFSKLYLGAVGSGGQPLANGWSISSVIMWQGSALSAIDLAAVGTALQNNESSAGVKFVLETGTTASWPGSGQKWLDTSGNGSDFFLGTSSSVEGAADPTFVGTPGDLTRNAYWDLDTTDFFTYDRINEAWMNAIHQDNAQVTGLVSFYVPVLESTRRFLMGDTASSAATGFRFYIDTTRRIQFTVYNSSGIPAYVATPSAPITATGWHVAAFSINEQTGTGSIMLDGVITALTAVSYATATLAPASATFFVGAAPPVVPLQYSTLGPGGHPIPKRAVTPAAAGYRLHCAVLWQGMALSANQLLLLYSVIAGTSQNYTLVEGFYTYLQSIDLGSVYTSRITAHLTASGISAGDTMDHWTTLAAVEAMDTSDPGSWSAEPVYLSTNGAVPKTLKQFITAANLTTNLKLMLDAGDALSWPGGAANSWLDTSGGSYDFFLGADATASATDPTFTGTIGSALRTTYWRFDGGDYFTYQTTNPAWVDNIHKDNSKHSGVVSVYIPALGGLSFLLGNTANDDTKVGFCFMVYTDKLYIKIFKGVTPTSFSRFGTLPVSVGWHTVGWSIDEAAGNGIYMVDGVTETFAVTYTTPSAAVSSYPLQIGAAGNAFTPLPNGTFIQSVAMWEGVALTAAQLVSLNMQHNDDYIWATEWLPYSTTDVTARALAFGIRLNGSVDGSSSPAVSVLGTSIDMPDRHLGFDNQNAGTSVGGYTILFSPPFKALKAISLANYSLDTSAGERYDIISSDANHVTIKFYKAPSTASTGAGLAKIFSLHAYGYGAVVQ